MRQTKFIYAPDPEAEQIKSMEMLSRFLQRNNCCAMNRGGDLVVMTDLERVDKYQSEEIEVYVPAIVGSKEEFEVAFKACIAKISRLQEQRGWGNTGRDRSRA